MFISLVTRSMSDLSFILSFSKILIATCSWVIVWVPILTFPNVPCPSDLPEERLTIQKFLTHNIVSDRTTLVSLHHIWWSFCEAIMVRDSCYRTVRWNFFLTVRIHCLRFWAFDRLESSCIIRAICSALTWADCACSLELTRGTRISLGWWCGVIYLTAEVCWRH